MERRQATTRYGYLHSRRARTVLSGDGPHVPGLPRWSGAVPPRLVSPSTSAGSARCTTLRKPGALGQLDTATHTVLVSHAGEGSEHSYTMAPAPWCVMDGV